MDTGVEAVVMSPYTGDFPPHLWFLLDYIWQHGLATGGDWARALAPEVALAASCGFISNVSPDGGTYSNRWRITASGLYALQHKDFMSPHEDG